jgi:hypothetical protein
MVVDAPMRDHTVLTRAALKKVNVKPGDRDALARISDEQKIKRSMSLMMELMIPVLDAIANGIEPGMWTC